MKDFARIEEILREHLHPFDILNFKPYPIRRFVDVFRYGYIRLVARLICKEGREFFGENSNWHHFHSELYLDPDHILNVIFPKNRWDTVSDVREFNFSVYRLRNFSFDEEDAVFARSMLEGNSEYYTDAGKPYKMKLVGTAYDVGDLFDFLADDILGYRLSKPARPFDFGINHKVCSTSCGIIYEALRKWRKRQGKESFPRLFSKIQEEKFICESPVGVEIVEEFNKKKKVYLESYRPAFYSNSDFFNHEFEEVLRVEEGEVVFMKE